MAIGEQNITSSNITHTPTQKNCTYLIYTIQFSDLSHMHMTNCDSLALLTPSALLDSIGEIQSCLMIGLPLPTAGLGFMVQIMEGCNFLRTNSTFQWYSQEHAVHW